MWDLQKHLWFDGTFLSDPLGYDSELTIDSFAGLYFMHMFVKPIATVLLAPLLFSWFELALTT